MLNARLDMPDEGWSSANVLNSKEGMFDRSVQAVSTHFQTLEQICIRHHPTFRALVQWEPYHAISSLDSRLWSVSGKWHSSSCPTSRGSVRKAWWPARSCSPVWPCNPRREIRMDHSCIDIIKYYKNIIKYYKYIWGIPQNAEIAGENGGKWIDNCFFSWFSP